MLWLFNQDNILLQWQYCTLLTVYCRLYLSEHFTAFFVFKIYSLIDFPLIPSYHYNKPCSNSKLLESLGHTKIKKGVCKFWPFSNTITSYNIVYMWFMVITLCVECNYGIDKARTKHCPFLSASSCNDNILWKEVNLNYICLIWNMKLLLFINIWSYLLVYADWK